jgi:hypothetical protein
VCLFGNLNFGLDLAPGVSRGLIEEYRAAMGSENYEKALNRLTQLQKSDQLLNAKMTKSGLASFQEPD